jgi:hypothetical protein
VSTHYSCLDKYQDLFSPQISSISLLYEYRPTSWLRSTKNNDASNYLKTLTPRSASSQRSKAMSMLAAATRKPFGRINSTSVLLDDARPIKKTKRSRSPSYVLTRNDTENSKGNLLKRTNDLMVSVSFAPPFVPATKRPNEKDATDILIEDPTRDNDHLVDIQNRYTCHIPAIFSTPHPPMKHPRCAKVPGKWGKRLMALRNSRDIDAVRLQNQAYARHSMMDLNNPRKRAKSRMDVTILGMHQGYWNLPEESSVTVLGYIHGHEQTRKSNNTMDANPEQDHNDATNVHDSEFAWVTFKVSTARIIGLDRGCLLRLYNAVMLPCPQATELILPQSLLEWNGAEPHYCKNVVVCTDVCERIDTKS